MFVLISPNSLKIKMRSIRNHYFCLPLPATCRQSLLFLFQILECKHCCNFFSQLFTLRITYTVRPAEVRILPTLHPDMSLTNTSSAGSSSSLISWTSGQQAEFQCESNGSRPAAQLSWFLRLRDSNQTIALHDSGPDDHSGSINHRNPLLQFTIAASLSSDIHDTIAAHRPLFPVPASSPPSTASSASSWSRSRLRLQMQPEMHDAMLICRAQNPNLKHLAIEHVLPLNVQCKFIFYFLFFFNYFFYLAL